MKGGQVVVYIATHGVTIPVGINSSIGYFIPSWFDDTSLSNDDKKRYARPENRPKTFYRNHCLRMSEVLNALEACEAAHTLVIADACFSGALIGERTDPFSPDNDVKVKSALRYPARQVITAGTDKQKTREENGHGIFTGALLDEFRERLKRGSPFSVMELFLPVEMAVIQKTKGPNGVALQNPQFGSVRDADKRLTPGHVLFFPGGKSGGPVAPRTATLTLTGDLADVAIVASSAGKIEGNKLTVTFGPDDSIIGVEGHVRAKSGDYEHEPFAKTLRPGEAISHPVRLRERGRTKTAMERAADRARSKGYPALADYLEQMCRIEGKTFTMGGLLLSGESPRHPVTLSSFHLGKTLVTVKLWREYDRDVLGGLMPHAPSWGWLDNHPMVNVSWNDIMGVNGNGQREDGKQAFCAWATEKAGIAITLPSEAQWEGAAIGKPDGPTSEKAPQPGKEYPWGKDFDPERLWASKKEWGDAKQTAPVLRSTNYFENSYGLLDMAGNVWQWCLDYYDPAFYGKPEATRPDPVNRTPKRVDPAKPATYSSVLRGGSWILNNAVYFRCTRRGRYDPANRWNNNGFRCASPAPTRTPFCPGAVHPGRCPRFGLSRGEIEKSPQRLVAFENANIGAGSSAEQERSGSLANETPPGTAKDGLIFADESL